MTTVEAINGFARPFFKTSTRMMEFSKDKSTGRRFSGVIWTLTLKSMMSGMPRRKRNVKEKLNS